MSTTAPPLPLTTVFTPPASCAATLDLWVLGYYNIYYNATEFAANVAAGCWPSGYSPASPFSPAPFLCPVGYSVACATAGGEVTTGVCCPSANLGPFGSGWPCGPESWSSRMTNSWPCGGFTPSGGLPLTFTGLFDNGSTVYGTTTLTAGSISGVASFGMGILVEWQSSDLPPGATPFPVTLLDAQTTVESSSSMASDTASTSSRNVSTSSPSAETAPPGLSKGAKAGIGIGIALFILLLGLTIMLVRKRRKSRAQSATTAHDDGKRLPPELSSKLDSAELEGERGVELDAGANREQKTPGQARISELEAELRRLRRNENISELP